MAEAETKETSGLQGEGLTWQKSLHHLVGESVPSYIGKYVAPTMIMGVVFALILQLLLGEMLGSMGFLVFLIPVFLSAVVLLYPKILADQRRIEIEQNMHFLITHLGVMATTGIPRIEIFRELGQQEQYGAIADEMRKISELVEKWNMALDEATRFQADRTASPVLADFLERLAYNIGAGQDIEEFLFEEQEVLMSQYQTMYEGALDDIGLIQDLFLSMVLSVAFVIVFATIIPILTGNDPMILLLGSVFLYGVVELGFLYAARVKVPNDPVWYEPDRKTGLDKRVERALFLSVSGVLILGVLMALIYTGVVPLPFEIPLPMYFAIPITPFAYPGLLMKFEESRIKERDRAFPSFIRSLGNSEFVRQSTTTKVMEDLQNKDFGSLTPNIRNLYKRLNMRLDQAMAWRHFAMETHSYLIQRFSEMYHRGRDKGGNTQNLGRIIGDNCGTILELRQRRDQASMTMIGVIYGMTGAMTFAYFTGIEVVKLMINMVSDIGLNEAVQGGTQAGGVGNLLHTEAYDIPQVQFLVLLFILINSILSSLMIRVIDGGHQINAYPHFVGLTWVGALTAVVTQMTVATFISL